LAICVAIVVWTLSAALLAWQYVVLAPETLERQQELRRLVESVRPPPGVELSSESSDSKPGQALVSATFRNAPAESTLRAHYDAVLTQMGWRFALESRTALGNAYCYQKPPYWATLEVPAASKPADYYFVMSWGLSCR
jgi:hypothetical protein